MKTHAAPVPALSAGPPTIAVLPSADSATEKPCVGGSHSAGADELRALLGELCQCRLRGAKEGAENQDGCNGLANCQGPIRP